MTLPNDSLAAPRIAALAALAALLVLAPGARSTARGAGPAEARPDPGVFLRDRIDAADPREHLKDVIRSIAWFRGRLWVGTYGTGLHVLAEDGSVERLTHENSPLLEDRVNCLASRDDRELWIGTCGGINVFDGDRWTKHTREDGVADNVYHAIRIGPDGRVWVGTTGRGISVHDGSTWKTYTSKDGLSHDWIDDILILGSGQVWATGFYKVVRFEGDRITQLSPSGPRMPYPILSLGALGDEVWVGTVARGVHLYREGRWRHPDPPELEAWNNKIRALVADARGRMWLATDLGVVRYDPGEGWTRFDADDGLDEPYTKVIHLDPHGRLWAGSWTAGVLSVLAPDSRTFVSIMVRGRRTDHAIPRGLPAGGPVAPVVPASEETIR